MAYADRFEELEIWQEARRLNGLAYAAVRDCREYFFRDQWNRAAMSVMNNIAEGFERRSNKDFRHFLDISKSSSGEMRSMTYAGEDNGMLGTRLASELRKEYELLSKRIAAFQSHL